MVFIVLMALLVALFFMYRAVKIADKRFDAMTSSLDPKEFLEIYSDFKKQHKH